MFKKGNYTLLFFFKMLLVPILFELVMGGGGHYLEVGPVTFRMLSFFAVMFISTLIIFFTKKIKLYVAVLLMALTIVIFLSAIVGLTNQAKLSSVLEDIKPLTFFYIILFFSLAVKNLDDIKRIIDIIKIGSISMAIIYLSVLALILLGKINFTQFYLTQDAIGEIMFRNELLFFYKGFLYLCIGFFFFLLLGGKYKIIAMAILFISIILTLTRGFILFTSLITIFYIFFINKKTYLKYLSFVVIIFLTSLIPFFISSIGNKKGSDSVRYTQVEQVIERVDLVSLFIGHGFGIGTPIRPGGMEISFLEIFHKQGVVGVSFWGGMFLSIFFMYYKIQDKEFKRLALPFLLSVIFVILQSTTNPYMNNPIGLSIILITIVVFSKLLEIQKKNRNDFSLPCNL